MHDTPRPTPDGFAAASADETRIAAPPVGSVVHASSYAAATHGPPLAVPNASHTKAFAPAAACLASAGPSTTAKMLPEVALPSAANSPAEAIAAAAAAAAASAAGLLPRVPAPIPVPALEMRAGAESVLSTRLSSSASAFPPSSVTWASHPLQLRKGPEAANNMEAAATVATSVASAAYAGRSALPPGTRAAAPGAGARAVPVPLPAPTPPTSTPASAAPSAYRSSAITVEALPPVTADTRSVSDELGRWHAHSHGTSANLVAMSTPRSLSKNLVLPETCVVRLLMQALHAGCRGRRCACADREVATAVVLARGRGGRRW